MAEKGRDEIPLVNNEGELIGSFSVSTLRVREEDENASRKINVVDHFQQGISSDLLSLLNEPVMTLSRLNVKSIFSLSNRSLFPSSSESISFGVIFLSDGDRRLHPK
jgi:hypothetical protein